MAGIFSGLEKLGLGNLGGGNLFEDPAKKEEPVKKEEPKKKLVLAKEEDFLFDKKYKCPVCEIDFSVKAVRTGKVRRVEPHKSQFVILVIIGKQIEMLWETENSASFDTILFFSEFNVFNKLVIFMVGNADIQQTHLIQTICLCFFINRGFIPEYNNHILLAGYTPVVLIIGEKVIDFGNARKP